MIAVYFYNCYKSREIVKNMLINRVRPIGCLGSGLADVTSCLPPS